MSLGVNTDDDLSRWLTHATRGLNNEISAVVREEIAAHYHDAVSEHRATGKSSLEAHRAAMAELGDVEETAHGLRDVHLAETSYRRAMVASMVFPVTYMLLVHEGWITQPAVMDWIINVSALLSLLYVIRAFKRLLVTRFFFDSANRTLNLLGLGAVFMLMPIPLAWVLASQPLDFEEFARIFLEPFASTATLLALLMFIGTCAVGLACVYLSHMLHKLDNPLYGLCHLLRFALLLEGITLGGEAIGLAFSNDNFSALMNYTSILVYFILCTLWTLVFFRAIYRGPTRPTQIA